MDFFWARYLNKRKIGWIDFCNGFLQGLKKKKRMEERRELSDLIIIIIIIIIMIIICSIAISLMVHSHLMLNPFKMKI
jgi:hypothetical protein